MIEIRYTLARECWYFNINPDYVVRDDLSIEISVDGETVAVDLTFVQADVSGPTVKLSTYSDTFRAIPLLAPEFWTEIQEARDLTDVIEALRATYRGAPGAIVTDATVRRNPYSPHAVVIVAPGGATGGLTVDTVSNGHRGYQAAVEAARDVHTDLPDATVMVRDDQGATVHVIAPKGATFV